MKPEQLATLTNVRDRIASGKLQKMQFGFFAFSTNGKWATINHDRCCVLGAMLLEMNQARLAESGGTRKDVLGPIKKATGLTYAQLDSLTVINDHSKGWDDVINELDRLINHEEATG